MYSTLFKFLALRQLFSSGPIVWRIDQCLSEGTLQHFPKDNSDHLHWYSGEKERPVVLGLLDMGPSRYRWPENQSIIMTPLLEWQWMWLKGRMMSCSGTGSEQVHWDGRDLPCDCWEEWQRETLAKDLRRRIIVGSGSSMYFWMRRESTERKGVVRNVDRELNMELASCRSYVLIWLFRQLEPWKD